MIPAAWRPTEAVPLIREALQIRRRSLPADDRWVIITALNLGVAYLGVKKHPDAETLLLEVDAWVVKKIGRDSEAGKKSAERLADLYEKWGKPDAAKKYAAIRDGK